MSLASLPDERGSTWLFSRSPQGDMLLTRMLRGIKIWNVEVGVAGRVVEFLLTSGSDWRLQKDYQPRRS